MSHSFCELVMDLKLIGLESKTIKFVYLSSTLENIDQTTYPYEDDKNFLIAKQENILKRLSKEKAHYGINIEPTSVEYNKERMFIRRGESPINPIFQNTRIKENDISTEILLRKFALMGSLRNLYLCDKKYCKDTQYISIFNGCDSRLLEKLEVNLITEEDFDAIWNTIKYENKSRIFSIMRFLLSVDSLEVMKEKFELFMPMLISVSETKETEEQLEHIRSPYKD